MKVLHSNIVGEGPALVVLHGFLGMSDNWKTLGNQYAAKGLQVHMVDQRNHGRSFHSADFDYGRLSGDLLAYMDWHGLSRAVVLGHSMGGKTAMQFACDHPGRVERLVVADIAPKYYPPHHQTIIEGLLALNPATLASRKEADQRLSQYIPQAGVRQFLLKNLYRPNGDGFALRINLPVLAEKMAEIGENIAASDRFDGPALFLRGDRSEYVTDADLPDILRHFPKAVLQTVDQAGHWLHAENPGQFLERTLSFIKGAVG